MRKERNYLLGYIKLILVCSLVFIHYPLQSEAGFFFGCLCRLTVPFFFIISGYYSYSKNGDEIVKKLKRISVKFVLSFLLYLAWEIYKRKAFYHSSIIEYLSLIFSVKNISLFLFTNRIAVKDHLWFMAALIYCYIFVYVYIFITSDQENRYSKLYRMSAVLLIIHFIISCLFSAADVQINYIVYRNALLLGLPMFAAGIFIHQYNDMIISRFNLSIHKIIQIFVIALVLAEIEWYGLGGREMPLGIFIASNCLFLIVNNIEFRFSEFFKNLSLLSDKMSMYVYIIHIIVYEVLCGGFPYTVLSLSNQFARNILVIVISLAISFLLSLSEQLIKNKNGSSKFGNNKNYLL